MAIRGYRIPQRRKTKVLYYDGSTLLGTKRYFRGKDVLHPSLTVPSKTNKTFIGWSTTTSDDDWVSSMVADGEPITLYAIYLDNTKTISSADSKYVTGTMSGWTRSTSGWVYDSVSFTLAKGKYASASITATASFDDHDTANLQVGTAKIDNTTIVDWPLGGGSYSETITAENGSHTLSYGAIGYQGDWPSYWQYVNASAAVTLSNPIAWT